HCCPSKPCHRESTPSPRRELPLSRPCPLDRRDAEYRSAERSPDRPIPFVASPSTQRSLAATAFVVPRRPHAPDRPCRPCPEQPRKSGLQLTAGSSPSMRETSRATRQSSPRPTSPAHQSNGASPCRHPASSCRR